MQTFQITFKKYLSYYLESLNLKSIPFHVNPQIEHCNIFKKSTYINSMVKY